MARKAITIVQLGVKFVLPTGVKIPDMQRFIRDAMEEHTKGSSVVERFDDLQLTISLSKKVVSYG